MNQKASRTAQFRLITLIGSTLVAVAIAVVAINLTRTRTVFNAEGFTIFILGGSTAVGAPYGGEVDFARIAQLCIGGDQDIRVENLGRSSMPAQYVLQQSRLVARNVRNPENALVLVYSGNNEFLQFDPAGSRVDRSLFDRAIVPPQTRANVVEAYHETMAKVISVLQEAKIAIVFSTVAVNQKDWEPNRSVLTNPSNQPRIEQLWWEADKAFKAQKWKAAKNHLRGILEVEPTFAHASFRLGRVCLELGETNEAKLQFREAIENDGNPTRALSVQNKALAELCRERGVPHIDAEALLESASDDGLIGYNLMWDNCHPTLEGYALIGSALAQEMGRLTGASLARTQISGTEVGKRLLSDPTETMALTERAQYCYVSALITWDRGPRFERAAYYLQRALEQRPDNADIYCSLGVLKILSGEVKESVSLWKRAYELDPIQTRTRINTPYVRELFRAQGTDDPIAAIAQD